MFRKLHIIAIVLLLLISASLLSLYSYGRFARHAQGAPSSALPADRIETDIDKVVAPLTDAQPGKTGLLLLADNLDAFAVRAVTARHAQRSLDLQYYIWHDDLTGRLLGYELLRAADRGVRVRLLLDDLNVHDKDTVLAALTRHPNIEVRLFNPARGRGGGFGRGMEMLLRGVSLNRRMHNKSWIADNRIAVIGGRNIGDEYFDASQQTNFFDIDIMMAGVAVAEASSIFDAFWNSSAVIPLQALIHSDENALTMLRQLAEESIQLHQATPYLQRLSQAPGVQELFRKKRKIHWTAQAHVYSDPPEKAFGQNEQAWLMNVLTPVWASARQSLHLISPYFVPGEEGVKNMALLRDQGVEISILTNSLAATDVIMVHGGYAPYRSPLLEKGVVLYELMPHGAPEHKFFGSSGASLHTKAFIVDGRTGFIGSFNLDPRSVRLNTEMGLMFEEPVIAGELLKAFKSHSAGMYSYRLSLQNGALRWEDGSVIPPSVWTHEPETGFLRRMLVKAIAWLPIESQL